VIYTKLESGDKIGVSQNNSMASVPRVLVDTTHGNPMDRAGLTLCDLDWLLATLTREREILVRRLCRMSK
jgi:hypothetical protein